MSPPQKVAPGGRMPRIKLLSAMSKPKTPKRAKPKSKPRTVDAFEFVNVCLAAGAGHLPIDTLAKYLAARRPAARKKRKKKR